MNNYHHNRRADEQLASMIAEERQRQKIKMTETYHFFVSGHTHFSDGLDEPRPVNISTIMTMQHPLLDDADLDELTDDVKRQLDEEAAKYDMKQVGFPTIRQISLLHVIK